MKIYLRTIFTDKDEVLYIISQILELYEVVDKFIIIEPGFTHNGEKRNKIGDQSFKDLLKEKYKKVDYIFYDISKRIIKAENSKIPFHNEKITRNAFYKYYEFDSSDIIICTDADEILYESYVKKIIEKLNRPFGLFRAFAPACHQFMFNDQLQAQNFLFYGPCIQKAFRKKSGFPTKWRNDGYDDLEIGGCHFSWCMKPKALINKLNSWAHSIEYGVKGLDGNEILKKILTENNYFIRNPNLALKTTDNYYDLWPKGYHKAKILCGYDKNHYSGTKLKDLG